VREFYLPLSETFTNGLRPRPEAGKGGGYLVRSLNLVPGPLGSIVPEIVFANKLSLAADWPFPQIAQEHGVVLGKTSLYELGQDNQLSLVEPIYGTAPEESGIIEAGGVWDIAGLGLDAWAAVNGETLLVQTPAYPLPLEFSYGGKAVALHNNRLVLDVPGSYFKTSVFGQKVYEEWKTTAANQQLVPDDPTDVSWLLFTRPLGSDIDYPLLADLALAGAAPDWLYNKAPGFLLDNIRAGAVELMPVYSDSPILGLESCAGRLLVFTSHETLWTRGEGRQLTRLARAGLRNRGASCTSPAEMGQATLWVSKNRLYVFEPDARGEYRVVPLGLKEHLEDLDTDQPIVCLYEPLEELFYVSHPEGCLVRSPFGVGQTNRPTTGLLRDTDLSGVFLDDCFTPVVEFETTEVDMNIQAFKTITSIELGGSGLVDLAFSVIARLDQAGSKIFEGPLVLAGDQAAAFMTQAGLAFRIFGQGIIRKGAEVNYVTIKWKSTDKRTIRGPHAPATEARTAGDPRD